MGAPGLDFDDLGNHQFSLTERLLRPDAQRVPAHRRSGSAVRREIEGGHDDTPPAATIAASVAFKVLGVEHHNGANLAVPVAARPLRSDGMPAAVKVSVRCKPRPNP